MKKFILFSMIVVLSGCSALYLKKANFTMGMDEKDFLSKNNAEMISAIENGPRVYVIFHQVEGAKYFVFEKGKLIRFDSDLNPNAPLYL